MLLKSVIELQANATLFLQGILNQSSNMVPASSEINTNPAPGIVNKKFICFDATDANERSKLKLFDEF
jgi:hypothetical protein